MGDSGSGVGEEDRSRGLWQMWKMWYRVNKERMAEHGSHLKINGDEIEVRVGNE